MIATLSILLKPYRIRLLGSVMLASLTTLFHIALFATAGYLLAASALHPQSVLLLWIPIIGVRFFGMGRAALRYAERLFTHDVTFRFLKNERLEVFRTIGPRYLHLKAQYGQGAFVNAVTHDVDVLQFLIIRVITPIGASLISTLFVFLFLSHFSLTIAMTTLLLQISVGLIIPFGIAKFAKKPAQALHATRQSFYTLLQDSLSGMSEIKAYGAQEQFLEKLDAMEDTLYDQHRKNANLDGLSLFSENILANIAMFIALIIGSGLVLHGQLLGVYLTMLVIVSLAAFEAQNGLPQAFVHFGLMKKAFQHLQAIAATPCDQGQGSAPAVTTQHDPITKKPHVTIKQLSVTYKDRTKKALDTIDLDLPFGKKVAIVGETGAGKSTLISSLLAMIDHQEGSITIDDIDTSKLSPDTIRRCYSVLSQESHLFQTTVEDNLRIGEPNASQSDLNVATRQAHIDKRIDAMPEGYLTLLGTLGTSVSVGEARRLMLARTLLRPAPIFIFDEPTQGFDPVLERNFIDDLLHIAGERSLLFITHRLYRLDRMDEILVMKEGKIIERGTHQELLALRGYYAQLFDLQEQEISCTLPSW